MDENLSRSFILNHKICLVLISHPVPVLPVVASLLRRVTESPGLRIQHAALLSLVAIERGVEAVVSEQQLGQNDDGFFLCPAKIPSQIKIGPPRFLFSGKAHKIPQRIHERSYRAQHHGEPQVAPLMYPLHRLHRSFQ